MAGLAALFVERSYRRAPARVLGLGYVSRCVVGHLSRKMVRRDPNGPGSQTDCLSDAEPQPSFVG